MDRDESSINSPLFRFFDRESIIGEKLLATVLGDLTDIQGVCNESVKPTLTLTVTGVCNKTVKPANLTLTLTLTGV